MRWMFINAYKSNLSISVPIHVDSRTNPLNRYNQITWKSVFITYTVPRWLESFHSQRTTSELIIRISWNWYAVSLFVINTKSNSRKSKKFCYSFNEMNEIHDTSFRCVLWFEIGHYTEKCIYVAKKSWLIRYTGAVLLHIHEDWLNWKCEAKCDCFRIVSSTAQVWRV